MHSPLLLNIKFALKLEFYKLCAYSIEENIITEI